MSTPKNAMPSYSVVIPTCHRNDLLAKALEALAPHIQQIPAEDYEVIVSDDGNRSTAEAFMRERFPWARWVKGPGKGPAANRNNGAATARADWLLFTDDDCLPETGWLRAYKNAIATGAAPVYEGRTYTEPNNKGPFWGAPTNLKGGLLWSCNMAIRRDAFLALGGFDAKFPYPHLEDVDFRERVKAAGHAFPFCHDAAVFHPLRPVGGIVRQALGHESYFYYAAKHGISLREAGLDPINFLRARLSWIRSSRNLQDCLRFCWRSAVESVLVAGLSIRWLTKFRSGKRS